MLTWRWMPASVPCRWFVIDDPPAVRPRRELNGVDGPQQRPDDGVGNRPEELKNDTPAST